VRDANSDDSDANMRPLVTCVTPPPTPPLVPPTPYIANCVTNPPAANLLCPTCGVALPNAASTVVLGEVTSHLHGAAGSAPDAAGTAHPMTGQAPSNVLLLSPVAGISFGQAPFLWPLFAGFDVAALAALGLVIKKV